MRNDIHRFKLIVRNLDYRSDDDFSQGEKNPLPGYQILLAQSTSSPDQNNLFRLDSYYRNNPGDLESVHHSEACKAHVGTCYKCIGKSLRDHLNGEFPAAELALFDAITSGDPVEISICADNAALHEFPWEFLCLQPGPNTTVLSTGAPNDRSLGGLFLPIAAREATEAKNSFRNRQVETNWCDDSMGSGEARRRSPVR